MQQNKKKNSLFTRLLIIAYLFLHFKNIFYFKLIFLVFLDCFNILVLKNNFFLKKIILMYFQIKNILKSNHYHNTK